jgi:AcrR family transcriptional regulator
MIEIPAKIKNKKLVLKRRKQIIFAAIKLFSKKGFHKATLRELSKLTKISHGNIYDYISRKEDIFFLIHMFIAKIVEDKLTKIINDVNDPIQKLQEMIKAEFEIMDKWADAILLLYQESHILKGSLLKNLLKNEREHISKFENAIQECVEKGIFRELNVRCIANLIKVMIDSWIIKRWDLKGYITPTEMERVIIDLIFNGLIKKQ